MTRSNVNDQTLRPSPPIPQTVLVTGGARGIGRAIAVAFGTEGWQVGVHCRSRLAEAEQTAGQVKDSGGDAFTLQADLGIGAEVESMVARFLGRTGRLDALICNAGMTVNSLLLRLSSEQWQEVIQTNLTGTFYCLRAAAPVMLEQRDGAIVIVGSYAAHQGRTGQTAYAASKAGLLGLMKTAAHEWGSRNVRVNAVFPGWHRTGLSADILPEDTDLHDHVLGRTPNLADVAQTIVRLTALRDVSGQVWNLDSRIG